MNQANYLGDYFRSWEYPDGAVGIELLNDMMLPGNRIYTRLNTASDLMYLLLCCDTLARAGKNSLELVIPFMPYARQDRAVRHKGVPLSTKIVGNIIGTTNINRVTIIDPHSDVSLAVFPQHITTDKYIPYSAFINFLDELHIKYKQIMMPGFIAPDASSLKRLEYYDGLTRNGLERTKQNTPAIYFNKVRDKSTGRVISQTPGNLDSISLSDRQEIKDWIVMDDICDGGASFVNIPKLLAPVLMPEARFHLWVTHGLFSGNAVRKLLNAGYSTIGCTNTIRSETTDVITIPIQ